MRTDAQWLRRMRVAVVAVPLVAVCCPYKRPPSAYETPPPHFATARVDSIPFDSIRAYGESLKYDTVRYAADVKRVVFDTLPLRTRIADAGDSAWIEPEQGAWALDTNELAQGRIVARIKTAHFHPAFGYGLKWTWWWIDKRGGQWRSFYFSDSLRKGIPDSLTIMRHVGYRWGQSIARWGSQWVTCSGGWCCSSPTQ